MKLEFGKSRRLAAAWAIPLAVLFLALLPSARILASPDSGGAVPTDLKVPVSAVLSQGQVAAGGTLHIAVIYQVPPDAHIQQNEFFTATPVDGEPFVVGDPLLPKAETFEDAPVYHGRTVVYYTARVSANLSPGKRVLKLDASHQACIEKPIFACFPPADSVLQLPVEIVAAGTAVHATPPQIFAAMKTEPPAPATPAGGGAPGASTATAPGNGTTAQPGQTAGQSASAAGPNGGQTANPADQAAGSPGAQAPGAAGLNNSNPAGGTEPSPGTAAPAAAEEGGLAGKLQAALARRSLLAFLLVFLGGVATSFTPCVYPMIPITISYIGGRSKGKLGGLFLSIFFVLGIAVTYSSLGIIAASTGALFGSAMQSTPVLLVVSAVFFAMGSSMLGAFDLALPSGFQTKLQTGPRGGVPGAFLMGIVTGLVASPCVGPVVVVLLTWVAQIGSIGYGFLLLFVFALGLGMLFLVLGTFAGALSALPQAGEWMDTVKHVFGVVLLGMGIFYLRTLIGPAVTGILTGALLLMVGTFIGAFQKVEEDAPKSLLLRKGFGIILLLVGGFVLLVGMARYTRLPLGAAAPESAAAAGVKHEGLNWISDDQAGRAQAQAAGHPAVIDFYADWCAACKELDEKTWSDPKVRQEGARFVAVKMDLTKNNDWSKRKQTDYGVPGLPTVIFYNGSGQEVKRFFGFHPPDEVASLMRGIR